MPFHPTRAAGFALIELMISILITLFLVAGMLGIIVSLKGSFTTQDQLGRVQESQLFALTVLDNTVRNAGYFANPVLDVLEAALPARSSANPDGSVFAAGQIITGVAGSAGASDSINVRFQSASGDGLMNCLGDTNTTGAALVWTNSFAVNSASQLTCTVTVDDGVPGKASVLVDNVSAMNVFYGIDSDADGVAGQGSADRYLNASDIVTTSQFPNAVSVKLQLRFLDLVNAKSGTTVTLPLLVHQINLMNKSWLVPPAS